MSSKTYDFLKRLVQVILPAFAAMYFGLAPMWNLPNAESVVGSTAIVCTFLGVLLGISSAQYKNSDAPYDGRMVVLPGDAGQKIFSLEYDGDLEHAAEQKQLVFKVVDTPTQNLPVE